RTAGAVWLSAICAARSLLWCGAQFMCVRAVDSSSICAARSKGWRDAQHCPVFLKFLLVIAQRAQVVCATRRVFGQG
ncbi:hypothetical protein A2U01_0037699, partial [Trifolium medium]|nr:hypothetical protein [Trifolium medium]